MKRFHWYFYVGLGLFQSLSCRYLQRALLFLCPMQLHGFEDNCFHWTQISFLSLRIRPSISWVGPGYNYTESSSSHQCVCKLSYHLICSNYFLYPLQLCFICSNYFLFAATLFILQQLFYLLHVPCGSPYYTEVKENHFVVNCINCDQILSENICRNINHRN